MSSAKIDTKNPERMHYIKGYVPVSYNAPHSSLERSSTWLGMGALLAALAGVGIILFALGSRAMEAQENWMTYLWIGVIVAAVLTVGGSVLIRKGRSGYRKYAAETGRSQ